MTDPAFVEPQLATLTDDVVEGPQWIFERKLDGNDSGAVLLDDASPRGWEGLIAKGADRAYHSGRNTDWLRLKCVKHASDVVRERAVAAP